MLYTRTGRVISIRTWVVLKHYLGRINHSAAWDLNAWEEDTNNDNTPKEEEEGRGDEKVIRREKSSVKKIKSRRRKACNRSWIENWLCL